MKLTTKTILFGLIGLALFSCKKETSQAIGSKGAATIGEATVPQGFAFNTEKDITIDLLLSDKNVEGVHRVDLYKKWDGETPSEMVYSTFMKVGESFNKDIKIPSYLEELYAVVNAPYGNSYLETIPVKGGLASYNLGYAEAGPAKKGVQTSPDCSSGCDATYNTSFNVNNGGGSPTVVCITGGSNLNVNLNKQNMEVRICGTVSFQNFGISKGTIVHITDGSNVTFHTMDVSSDAEMIIYDADVTVTQNAIVSGKLTNNGKMDVRGEMNVNSKGNLINNDTIDVVGHFNNNEELTNYGRITAGGHIHFNGNSLTYNHCYMYTGDQLHINNNFHNYGYIEAVLKITFAANNQGANKIGTMLYNGSMVKGANGAFITGYVQGNGTTSLIQITAGESKITGGGTLTGNVEFCDADVLEVLGTVSGLASVSCNAVIQSTACNPGTPGTPPCTDSDNDGVCDDVDKFPNDPDLAGCNCYPDCNNFGTLTYEDLWPGVGDYDFNDLVVEYQYVYLTNADNNVAKIKPSFLITAIGASFKNGFGFQLETAPSSVSSVSGQIITESYLSLAANGTENGQSKATIMAFDNSKTAFSAGGATGLFQNTITSEPYQQPDTIKMEVVLSSPVSADNLGDGPHNPFLVVDMIRGREVHLMNHEPTDLADHSYFGANSDASDPGAGKYYHSKNGFPWALNLPVSFDYPIEKQEITKAYLFFIQWVESGGTTNTDWYLDNPGYRNNAFIY